MWNKWEMDRKATSLPKYIEYHCESVLNLFFLEIKCPKLAAPQYGKVFVSGQHPGDYAYYRCGYGYSLKGNRRRVCLHNGNWSGSDSSCTKDDDHYGGYGGYKDHEY